MTRPAAARPVTANVGINVGIGQLNPTVGGIRGNTDRMLAGVDVMTAGGADLIIYPETAICGYPSEDLLLRGDYMDAVETANQKLAAATGDVTVIWGTPLRGQSAQHVDTQNRGLLNSAIAARHGQVSGQWHKQMLPDYGPFDETRWFGNGPAQVDIIDIPAGHTPNADQLKVGQLVEQLRVAVLICEDVWADQVVDQIAGKGPAGTGEIDLIVVVNASPYSRSKHAVRIETVQRAATKTGVPAIYVNQVGGQDTLIFDGRSFICAADGTILYQAAPFIETFDVVQLQRHNDIWTVTTVTSTRDLDLDLAGDPGGAVLQRREHLVNVLDDGSEEAEIWAALVTAAGDYIVKNRVLDRGVAHIPVSGGIDSAVSAAICGDAVGGEHIVALAMPGPYSNGSSADDAEDLARRIGAKFETLPIGGAYQAVTGALFEPYEDQPAALDGNVFDVTQENIQARLRGVLIMALSNRRGGITITCGNRTEAAVGYSTLYGDMAGGYNIIGDVPKTMVWQLAEWRNRRANQLGHTPPIPQHSITRPASAELAPGQKDENTLGDYYTLDRIVEGYVDHNLSLNEIVAQVTSEPGQPTLGRDMRMYVASILRMIDRAEYKRRQAAPAPKIGPRAFSRERRVPITSLWDPARPDNAKTDTAA